MKVKLLDNVKLYGKHRKSGEEVDVTEEDGLWLCEQGLASDMANKITTHKRNGTRLSVRNGRFAPYSTFEG